MVDNVASKVASELDGEVVGKKDCVVGGEVVGEVVGEVGVAVGAREITEINHDI